LDPSVPIHDYYIYYPYKNDGGYLKSLVEECRLRVSALHSYNLVMDSALEFARLYSCLQVYKHISLNDREYKLFQWAESYSSIYTNILPQEFCAAAGSTLGIFMLFALSSSPNACSDDVVKIKNAYFPWVCGLHILLDYFIDINEDIENNDLNFIRYYQNTEEMQKRLCLFLSNSIKSVSSLNFSIFHTTMVLGLLAMYLSDNKAYDDKTSITSKLLVSSSGVKLKLMHGLCRKLRKKDII
jgi:tetraprenyl-beta-curcumene synthase